MRTNDVLGVFTSLFFCVNPKQISEDTEEVDAMLCFALAPSAANDTRLSEPSVTQPSDNLTIVPSFDAPRQEALFCSCVFLINETAQEEEEEEQGDELLRQIFPLPGYTGESAVPVNCVCKDWRNITNETAEADIDLPTVKFDEELVDADELDDLEKISLQEIRDVEFLFPARCSCGLARAPFFGGVIERIEDFNQSMLCKCNPTINPDIERVAISNTSLILPVKLVDVSSLNLTVTTVDMLAIEGDSDMIEGWQAIYPDWSVVRGDVEIFAPPYFNVSLVPENREQAVRRHLRHLFRH